MKLKIKDLIKKVPVFGVLARKMYKKIFRHGISFPGSKIYWIEHYNAGGNSGAGSYNELANFKAEVLNSLVKELDVQDIIEFGCGDGNQLKLAQYPSYIGFDVSQKAVSLCREIFHQDSSKKFELIDDYRGETAQLTLSIDVIYHLIEDYVFHQYMERLMISSNQFVIIYSTNTNFNPIDQASHVKHRVFTKWIERYAPSWKLIKHIPNRFSPNEKRSRSSAEFYVFEKH
jgi:hypothetical protein